MRPISKMHHATSDSEVTSLDAASSPPRSPRRPAYYVQSPSQHDAEKLSYGSSPVGSPTHHHHHRIYNNYQSSPIHHSRESSTSRFSSVSLKNPHWRKLDRRPDPDDDGGEDPLPCRTAKFYSICFVCSFVVLFSLFCLILWAVSAAYAPKIAVRVSQLTELVNLFYMCYFVSSGIFDCVEGKWKQSILFEGFNVQAGTDGTGVPTDMLSLNSTVRISYRNPSTFFGVHVTSTPFDLHHYQLKLASGFMAKFYLSRKKRRAVTVVVQSSQVAVYGGISLLGSATERSERMVLPLNLTFVMRSRASVLGKLVKRKFYAQIRCSLTFRGGRLGKPNNLTHSCAYYGA